MLDKMIGSSTVSNSVQSRARVLVLLGFHLAWGCALWWSVSVYGLGTSRDSAEYLFTSLSLARGDGFISFMGHPYVLWPPLYPMLLSLLQIFGATDPMRAALALQLITFIWIAALTAWLFSSLLPRNFALAFLGNAIVATGIPLTWLFQSAGSDYLFIALMLSMVYLCDNYTTKDRLRTLWLMILVSALAMLQRYIGITLLFTAAWVVFQYSRGMILERLKRAVLMGISVIPVGIWARTLPVEAVIRDNPSSFLENLYWFTFSTLSWFIPEAELYGHPVRLQFGMWGLWLGALAGGLIIRRIRRKSKNVPAVTFPLFLFGIVYTVVLLAVASLSSFNSLDSRFVSPIFIPLVVLVLVTIETILSSDLVPVGIGKTAIRLVMSIPPLIVLGLSGYRSVVSMQLHHELGGGYTSKEWHHNRAIEYWQSHEPEAEYLAFSNYPAGVALQTWHVALSSPRRTAHPNAGEAVIPLDTYLPSLFVPGKDSYIVWIEPNEYTHVYSVADLEEIAEIETLYEGADGGVYRILPLK
jgi:hypothetical protein